MYEVKPIHLRHADSSSPELCQRLAQQKKYGTMDSAKVQLSLNVDGNKQLQNQKNNQSNEQNKVKQTCSLDIEQEMQKSLKTPQS